MNYPMLHRWLIVITLCLLTACTSSPNVNVDFSPDFQFATVKSYAIVQPPADALSRAGLAGERVESAVREQMAALGVAEVGREQADIYVGYGVVTEEKTRVTTYPDPVSYRCYRCGYGYGGWGGSAAVDVHEYTQGTLVVDLIKPDTRKVVWRGVGTANVSSVKTPEERTQLINAHVAEMFKQLSGAR